MGRPAGLEGFRNVHPSPPALGKRHAPESRHLPAPSPARHVEAHGQEGGMRPGGRHALQGARQTPQAVVSPGSQRRFCATAEEQMGLRGRLLHQGTQGTGSQEGCRPTDESKHPHPHCPPGPLGPESHVPPTRTVPSTRRPTCLSSTM